MKNKNLKNYFKPRSYKVKKARWTVFDNLCKGCFLCKSVCPFGSIEIDKDNLGIYNTPSVKVDSKKCQVCHNCEQICPDSAIKIE